jgi:hypothetical protein
VHSKIDYSANGLDVDNAPADCLLPGAPLQEVVAQFLHRRETAFGAVDSAPLLREGASTSPVALAAAAARDADAAAQLGLDVNVLQPKAAPLPPPVKRRKSAESLAAAEGCQLPQSSSSVGGLASAADSSVVILDAFYGDWRAVHAINRKLFPGTNSEV